MTTGKTTGRDLSGFQGRRVRTRATTGILEEAPSPNEALELPQPLIRKTIPYQTRNDSLTLTLTLTS